MNHELKILPEYYRAIASGSKTFEIRMDDRNFQVGDTLSLRQWTPEGYHASAPINVEVTYITAAIGIAYGFVCMAIRRNP